MCGRYVIAGRLSDTEFSERVRLRPFTLQLPITFNAAPSQMLPVIVEEEDGERVVKVMRWGLEPRWKGKPGGKPIPAPINARSETVLEKPMFRSLVGSRRCLVPASGFYEWQARSAGPKLPHFISLRDEPFFGFAGLYDERTEEDGDVLASYTILTTSPNEVMASIHNRMPVILPADDEEEWLSREVTDGHQVERLLRPYPAEEMETAPVSTTVNNVRNDGPELIEPVDEK